MSAKIFVRSETPTITQEFFDELERRFKFTVPSPGDPIEQIMFDAGKQSVIDWCRDHIKNTVQDNRVNRTIP